MNKEMNERVEGRKGVQMGKRKERGMVERR